MAVPGGDGDGAEVEVVPDGVLQVVVQPALGEPRVQVLPQVTRDRPCNSIKCNLIMNFKIWKFGEN